MIELLKPNCLFSSGRRVWMVGVLLLLMVAFGSTSTQAKAGRGEQLAREANSELLLGNIDRALQLYTQALISKGLPSAKRATILNDRGVANWRGNKVQQALDDFNKSVSLFPEYPAVYNNRGNVLLALNMPAEAIRDYNRAIILAPNYAAAFNNRANAYLKLKQTAEAERDFAAALKLSPKTPDAHNGKGRIQLAAGRPYAALRQFNKAMELSSDYSEAHLNRADAYLKLNKYDAAVDDLTQAITASPDRVDLYVKRGRVYLSLRNYNAALKDFTTALEFEPDNADAHAERGLTYVRIQTYDPAAEDLDRAIALNPRNGRAFAYRALGNALLGEVDLAKRDIDVARKIAKDDPVVTTIHADILEAIGDREGAVALHRQVLAGEPGRKPNMDAMRRLTGNAIQANREVAGAGLDNWRVFRGASGQFFATNPKYRNLRVPLEVFGDTAPRVLEWTVRKRPFRGVGVLRFLAGRNSAKTGVQDLEYVAIIDLWKKKVVALEPFRKGNAESKLTWSNGVLTVASLDGLTSQFQLRQRAPARQTVQRRQRQDSFGWSSEGAWQQRPRARPRVRQSRRQYRRRQQPKTLFDLFFNN